MANIMVYPIINSAETSKRLKALRKARNLSISEVQKVFGISCQAIYGWENATVTNLPSLDNIIVLAQLYDTSIDNMLVVDYIAAEPEHMDYAESLNAIAPHLSAHEMRKITTRYECLYNFKEMMESGHTPKHDNI